jgi:hypothetical protein
MPVTRFMLFRISGVEIIAALFRRVRKVHLRHLMQKLRPANSRQIFIYNRYQIVEVAEHLTDAAMILAEEHGLRGLAAAAEGLIVENSNDH